GKFLKTILMSLKLLTTSFFILLFASLRGQSTNAEPEKYKHSLGMAAGYTTGYGLSYRFMPQKFGAQLAFAPYKSGKGSAQTETYNIGLTFLYNLVESKVVNLFIYEGNSYTYHSYYT